MVETKSQMMPRKTGKIYLNGRFAWDAKILEITHYKDEITVHYENETMRDQEFPLAVFAKEPGQETTVDWADKYLTTLFFEDGQIISYWTSVK